MLHKMNTGILASRFLGTPVYPIGCEATWLWPTILQDTVSANLYDWLVDIGSLTARLKQHCREFSVQVLIEGTYPLSDDEQAKLNLTDTMGFVREVLLLLDGVPWVFARTIMPLSTLTGAGEKLAQLGNQPLGAVLFNAPDMQRSAIEIAEFGKGNTLHELANTQPSTWQGSLFGRRSCFLLDGKSLLVSEVFLPDAMAYK
jgi:chorismate--pyruvate lyase